MDDTTSEAANGLTQDLTQHHAFTAGYLDEIAKKYAGPDGRPASDYRLADVLQITRQAVSLYRKGESSFSDEVAMKVATELQISPAIVMAYSHLERNKNNKVRAIWLEIARKLARGTASAITLAILASGSPSPAQAGGVLHNPSYPTQDSLKSLNNIHYATKRRRKSLWALMVDALRGPAGGFPAPQI